MDQCTSFAPSAKLLVERVNFCKTCTICMLLCSWFQEWPYALDFYKIMLIIIMFFFLLSCRPTACNFIKKETGVSRCFPKSFNKYLRVLTEHLLSLVSFLIYSSFRSSRSRMFFKIVALKIFAIFTGKHLCWHEDLKIY